MPRGNEKLRPLVVCDIPDGAIAALRFFAAQGVLGESVEEVASYLMTRAIDDLWRAGTFRLDKEEALP